jgi:hypothetical protein
MKLYRTDGSLLLELRDQEINRTDTSLALVGQGTIGYSSAWAQNFVALTENFASATPPNKPMIGQIWYDASNKLLKVFSGNGVWDKATGITNLVLFGRNGISVQGSPVTTTGTVNITLENTSVTEGYYSHPTITVDAQGRIIAAASGLTTQTGAVNAIYLRSTTRTWKIEINDQGDFIKTPIS